MEQETDQNKVLETILPYALTISQAEIGAFLVADDESDHFNPVAKQEMPDEMIKQLTTGDLGRLLLMGKQLWMKPQSSQLNTKRTFLGQHKLKYLFGMPLHCGGRVLGAIAVAGHITGEQSFGQEQQRGLTMLAQVVALFLDNIRLRTDNSHLDEGLSQAQAEASSTTTSQRSPSDVTGDELEQLLAAVMSSEEEVANQNKDLGLLNTLSHEVGGTLQPQAILESAVKQSQSALGVQASWCYLFEGEMLTLCEHQNLSERYVAGMLHLAPGDGVEGMAFSRNEPVLRDGVLFHSGKARTLVQEEGLRTVAAVPLRTEEKTLGVLAVANHHDWVWSSRDRRMLVSIGQQVAQAIANSQKFNEVQEKAQNWETNYSALQNVNTQLTRHTEALKQEIEELQQAEQQIWTALAASQKTRRQSPDTQTDQQLAATLRKVLTTMGTKEYQLTKE